MNNTHRPLSRLPRIWKNQRSKQQLCPSRTCHYGSRNFKNEGKRFLIYANTNRQIPAFPSRGFRNGTDASCHVDVACRGNTAQQIRRLSNFYHGPEYGRHKFMAEEEITDEMATKILRQHEMSVTMKEDFDHKNVIPVVGFESNILSSNSPLEDRRAQAKFHHNTDSSMLFGVFDGHGGHQCANAVSNRLFLYLALSFLPHQHLQTTLRDLDEGKPWPALLEWYQHSKLHPGVSLRPHQVAKLRRYMEMRLSGDIVINNVEDMMHHSCKQLDSDILDEAKQQTVYKILKHARPDLAAIDCAMSGCVACFAHISQDVITVANIGDSRAVLGSRDPVTPGRWIATALSRKHNSLNEDEKKRIISEHPQHERDSVIRNDRLLGSLAPFRAFGNARFKWSPELINEVAVLSQDGDEDIGVGGDYRIPDQTNWVLPFYRTPPYLTSTPDIIQHEIQANDSFLVLATDGLWDTMHKSNVVQIIGEHIDRAEGKRDVKTSDFLSESDILDTDLAFFGLEDVNAATNIIRHCIGQTFDGPSRRQVRAMLSLSTEESRFYRDDITVTIVKLNPLAT